MRGRGNRDLDDLSPRERDGLLKAARHRIEALKESPHRRTARTPYHLGDMAQQMLDEGPETH